MISIKGIESLIDCYSGELNNYNDINIKKIQLKKINNDIIHLKTSLSRFKGNKNFQSVNNKLSDLQFIVDRGFYEVKKNSENQIEYSSDTEITKHDKKKTSPEVESDITELRKRLLTNSSLLDNSNTYHETIQEDLIHDLTNLATDLKNGAINMSYKLVADEKMLSRTQNTLAANEKFMNIVGNNLNNYVMNKSGGTISFWFLIKVAVGSVVLFIIMLIIINILPKM